jgi:acetyl esterase/lipase
MVATRRVLPGLLAGVALLAAGCAGQPVDAGKTRPVAAARDLGSPEVHRELVFAQRDSGPLKLDLFLPARSAGPTPLVVYVHGGGWDAGRRSLDADAEAMRTAEALAAERLLKHSYAVATVDYRLSEVVRDPAQLIDVGEAVRWLQQRADQWHLDSDRLVLWGASAGGHLVAQAGAVAGDQSRPGGGISGIRAVVDWFGPTDMSAEAQVEHPELGDYARRVVRKFLGCLPVECPAAAEAASPIRNLSGDEPPFLIQHGTADTIVPVDQSLDFAEQLRRVGVSVDMHPYEGVDHGFGSGPQTPQILDTMVAFVDKHLAR